MFEMLGNVFINLFSRPAARKCPHESRETFGYIKGQIGITIENCIFCGICAEKCPAGAIIVNPAEASWEIDPYMCINCGLCTEVCLGKCLRMKPEFTPPSYTKEKSRFVLR